MMTTYTVKARDTLWAIGRNHVGLNWRFLAALNPDIKDPNKIYVGQKIAIPDPDLVYWISQFIDIAMMFCGWKVGVLISVLRFVVQAGTFNKKDVTQFCIQQGLDAIFAAKI
jgi:LysM repeat protein